MKKRVLFICSRNKFRSATAHEIFSGSDRIEVDSAGTETDARVVVELEHILWADVIYVMDDRHRKRLREMFGQNLKAKRMVVLDIPDLYKYMDPALIEILRSRLRGLA